MKSIRILSLILISTLFTQKATAQKDSWEAGIGTTMVSLPQYPGSSQRSNFILPFPFFHIQSKYLDFDDGAKGFFFESPNLRTTISAGLGLPVDSKDNRARQGMPDLNTVLQIGPSLEFIFAGGRRQPSEFRLELPLRAAIATDFTSYKSAGWLLEPRITYETLRPFKSGFNYQVSSGLLFASKDYNAYYYDVAPQFATAQRPAFSSAGGYNSFFIDLSANLRKGDWVYFVFSRYRNLSGATYIDSPLVEQNASLTIGAGIIWIFANSL